MTHCAIKLFKVRFLIQIFPLPTMLTSKFRILAAVTISSVMATTAFAAVFPDVPNGHMYQKSIEELVSAGAINGNPDGNFYPGRSVNRAEMLKMLYLATGRQPDRNAVRCFPDVTPGSWYESFVCDAAANRFVNGYSDGTFRPANEVNRVEALKMIQEVFNLQVQELTTYDLDVINFVDVSTSAWYTKYIFNAYGHGILPIVGQDSSRFYPDYPLLRGEAAAMIFNALYADIMEYRQFVENQLAQEESEEEEEIEEEEPIDTSIILETDIPFDRSGKFSEKKPTSYKFIIDETDVIYTESKLQSGQPGSLTCTLFKLEESGFSDEYYIGTSDGSSCYLLTTLTPGSYQLQIQPSSPNVTYTAKAELGIGDGNDGFSEALGLNNTAKSYYIDVGNFDNWYTFSVDNYEKRMKVELTNITNLRCIVYSMSDVDLFGFSSPECNNFFTYPEGTYYVSVSRKAPKSSKQTYTIRLVE